MNLGYRWWRGAGGVLVGLLITASLVGCDSDNDNRPPSTATATATVVATLTRTLLATPTATSIATTTTTPTSSATASVTATHTNTATATGTTTSTSTATPTATNTDTPTATATATDTPTATATDTPTSTATATDTTTASPTATVSGPFITTLVGTGLAGLNGDGLPGINTDLYLPQDVTVGPDGNLYILDWNNHRIRRVVNRLIETVAGSGELGDAQDGPALDVNFNHPTNVAFDPQGRMVIAAWHNSEVKRLDFTTGLVTNLAGTGARAFGGDGGPGNQAKLDLPSSVAVYPNGNILISDQANFRIRMLDTAGTITTIAGTGAAGYFGDGDLASAAQLNSPKGQSAAPAGRIVLDSRNRIIIADTGNHCIRMIDENGMISTVAGTGTAGYSGDGGPATVAKLNTPSDVAVADDGTLYIADTMNSVVRMVTPAGIISTFAGTGDGGFGGDGGPAIQAKLDRPYGITVGPDGVVYVADTHNHRVRRITPTLPADYDPNGGGDNTQVTIIPCTDVVGSICTYTGTGELGFNGDGLDRLQTTLYWPFDIEFTPRGHRYVVDWNNHKVREILADDTFTTVMGSDFVGDGPPDLSDLTDPGAPPLTVNLNHPVDLQEFPNGDLVVMSWHNHKIRVLNRQTNRVRVQVGRGFGFTGDDGPAKSALLNQPPHSTFDQHGNLFVIDQRNQRIRVIYDFATKQGDGVITTVVGTGVAGFNGDGAALQTQVKFPAGPNPEPSGSLAFAPNGALYFSDTLNHRIRRVDFQSADFKTATVTTIAGTGMPGYNGDGIAGINAQLNQPEDLEIGPDGNLYFADTNNNRVRMIDLTTTGMISTIAGTGEATYSGDGGPASAAALWRPFGVAFDKFGDLYISDTFNGRIRKVSRGGGPSPIFPADYRANFALVRDCRFSAAHGGVSIRVYTNAVATQPYLDNANPLPLGSVVVKEEFSGTDCNDDSKLVQWRVMRKEAPGFDPDDADWHWQRVSKERAVIFDTKDTCIGCHRVADCLARDYMCTVDTPNSTPTEVGTPPTATVTGTPPTATPTPTGPLPTATPIPFPVARVQPILTELPAALLSITGTAANDVYAVGADGHDDMGPTVLHYNGQFWRRLNTGVSTGTLWWISVTPIIDEHGTGAFYLAGENGVILRYEPATGTFTRQTTPGTETLFGVWGSDDHHIWAVGGDLAEPDQGGVVWFYDGATWAVDANIEKARLQGIPTLYKVWGRSETDLYVVGRLGLVFHFDGIHWSQVPVDLSGAAAEDVPLFTIHGNATEVIASGGFLSGVLEELIGGAFANRAIPGTPQMNGVFLRADGTAVAVGVTGAVAFRNPSGWRLQRPALNTSLDFHSTWIDPDGGVWAVGGDLTTSLNQGMIAYGGPAAIGTDILTGGQCAPGTSGGPSTVSYTHDIVPLFAQTGCLGLSCHGGSFPTSGYDLRTYETSFGPGSEATSLGLCNIVPGNLDASYVIEKLTAPRMGALMPDGRPPLTSSQLALIRTWILEGAQNDAAPAPTPTPAPPPMVTQTPAAACSVSGVICTVAGNGLAQFNGDGKPALQTSFYFPLEVTFDGAARPLIVDFNNLRIRRLDTDGTIETIMGTGFENFPADGALAIDTPLHHASDIEFDTAGNLYVAGDHVPVVFRVGIDNRVFTVAGTMDPGYDGDGGPARLAKLTTPFAVLPTNDGGFYISDVDAHVIRYVDSTGTIRTVAGTGSFGYAGDGAAALAATLKSPTRMRRDGAGNLYFCDTNSHVIRRIDLAGVITTVAGTGVMGYSGDHGPATAARFNTPYDLRLAPNGDLYVADTGNNVIRRIDHNGVATTVVGIGIGGFAGDLGDARNARLNRPSALTFDADGALWISDTSNQRVRRVTNFLSTQP